jgi:hypothetical protein
MLEEVGLSLQEFTDLYDQYGSEKLMAKALGVSYRVVKKYMALGKRKARMGRPRYTWDKPWNDCLAQWCKQNPGVKIPRLYRGIVDKTGIPFFRLKWIFRVRRRLLLEWATQQGNLCELNQVLRSTEGLYIPTRGIETYRLAVDTWATRLIIKGTLKVGMPFVVELSRLGYGKLFRKAKEHSISDQSNPHEWEL